MFCVTHGPKGPNDRFCNQCGAALIQEEVPTHPVQEPAEDAPRPQGWGVFYQWGDEWTCPFQFQTSLEAALAFYNGVVPFNSENPHYLGLVSYTPEPRFHVITWIEMVWNKETGKWDRGAEVKEQDYPTDFTMGALERGGISG